jgi:hypothetical protein
MNQGGGVLKSVIMTILGLITFTFGLLVFLYVLTFFPNDAVANFAGAALDAGSSILGAIRPIVEEVVQRFRST